ncbi:MULTISPECIES: dihydrodipicolinate synthase family protein [unclassified Streptomyces]|uniref:dihydrodipicolinate synthase family protein n=1 Tax=unclassified Streptomyces TaxID=2593676 RepID=UPI00036E944B|nr:MULTISPECIES: dihydrodipicolinate synthase family protein [unclassified Streptomyces]EYT80984.1 glucose dehydrogenase [Streptomyces sp. Tu 6176]
MTFPAFPAPLTGVVPPVCTPLTPEGEVDVGSLLRLVDHLVAGGVHGLFVLGTASEAAFLTDRQRRQVVEAVAGHVGAGLPVLAGAVDMTTARVLDQVAAVAAAGARAVVVTAPFYAAARPAEVARHYRRVAAASPVPVLAHDIPAAVHTKLPAALVLELAGEGVLAGLKDSSGELDGFREVAAGVRADSRTAGFSVLTGSERLVDVALALGADGAVPGLANVDPHGFVRLYRLARAGDAQGARAEQERLCALFALTRTGGPGPAAPGPLKAALHLRGIIACPATAGPQLPLTEREVSHVRDHLAAAGLL